MRLIRSNEIRIRKRVEAILYARPKSDPDRRELRRLNDELNEVSKVTTRDDNYHANVARLTDRHLFLAQEWDEAVREFENRI
jgi:SNF2 family DNA or RNA helicase